MVCLVNNTLSFQISQNLSDIELCNKALTCDIDNISSDFLSLCNFLRFVVSPDYLRKLDEFELSFNQHIALIDYITHSITNDLSELKFFAERLRYDEN